MRSNEAAVTRGKDSTSKLKKEAGRLDNDQGWKNGELKKQEAKAKAARAPGTTEDRTAGLSVPESGKK